MTQNNNTVQHDDKKNTTALHTQSYFDNNRYIPIFIQKGLYELNPKKVRDLALIKSRQKTVIIGYKIYQVAGKLPIRMLKL